MIAIAVERRRRAARAEDDVRIAEGRDVFGGRDELVDRAHVDAALQQHGVSRSAIARPIARSSE